MFTHGSGGIRIILYHRPQKVSNVVRAIIRARISYRNGVGAYMAAVMKKLAMAGYDLSALAHKKK